MGRSLSPYPAREYATTVVSNSSISAGCTRFQSLENLVDGKHGGEALREDPSIEHLVDLMCGDGAVVEGGVGHLRDNDGVAQLEGDTDGGVHAILSLNPHDDESVDSTTLEVSVEIGVPECAVESLAEDGLPCLWSDS